MDIEREPLIEMRPIGIIHSPFTKPEEVPIQPVYALKTKGRVIVYPEYAEGLKDIEGFSHISLIYHFHLAREAGEVKLVRKPFLDGAEHGIFAISHFARPNTIGISVVKLLGVEDNIIEVESIDVIDGTPLLDIKPYIPQFRAPGHIRTGWFKGKKTRGKHIRLRDFQ